MHAPDSLSAQCSRARDALLVASHLADKVDAIAHMMPLGYGVERSVDGTPRPTESLVVASDDRGVTDRRLRARRRISHAALLLEASARELDEALNAWEGRR